MKRSAPLSEIIQSIMPDIIIVVVLATLAALVITGYALSGMGTAGLATHAPTAARWARMLLTLSLVLAVLCNPLLLLAGGSYWGAILGFFFWLGQWIVLLTAAAATALSVVAYGPAGNWQALIGLLTVAITFGFNLPDLEEATNAEKPRRGIVQCIRIKRERGALARRHFNLDQPRTFGTVSLPKGATVHLDDRGRLVSAEVYGTELVHQGIAMRKVEFDPESGALRAARLSRDQVVQGIPCRKEDSGFADVEFSAGGKMLRCTLAQPHSLAGVALPTGSSFSVNEEKGLLLIFLSNEAGTEVAGITVPPKARLRLRLDGRPVEIEQPYEPPIEVGAGVRAREVHFDEKGCAVEAILYEDAVIKGRPARRGERIRL